MSCRIESVLLVDDDERLLRAYARRLRGTYAVLTANTPEQATSLARDHRPNAALVDLNLGLHSGISVVHALKAEHPAMPVALMSASLAVEVAAHIGADYAFSKEAGVNGMLAEMQASAPLERPATPNTLAEAERDFILRTLAANEGNISKTAQLLDIRRYSLQRKLSRKRRK